MSAPFDVSLYQSTINVYLTDTCTIYQNTANGPDGLGAADGRGGYGDNRGGQTPQMDIRADNVPCRLSNIEVGVPLREAGDKATQVTRFYVAIPATQDIANTDVIETDAGNNGIIRRLEVEDAAGGTNSLTRQVIVKQIL